MSSADSAEPSGSSLRWVLGGITVLVVALGVLAYWRYAQSEKHFAHVLAEMDVTGKTVDAEGCITAVLNWHEACEANKVLCDQGAPMVMTHCLVGRDRTSDCSGIDLSSARAQWVWHKCEDRGTPCTNRRQCTCADAYRTLASFCQHEQRGVPL